MAAGQSFAGVECPGAAELHFANQLLWEREEAKANSTRAKSRPGKGPSGSLHGRRPWSSPASTDGAQGTPFRSANGRGESGEEGEAHHSTKRGKDGSERRISRGGSRRSSGVGSCAQQAKNGGEERGKMGEGALGRAGALHLKPRRGERRVGANVGAGLRLGGSCNRGREDGGGGWREEGDDRRARPVSG